MSRIVYSLIGIVGLILFLTFFIENVDTLREPLSLRLSFGQWFPINLGPSAVPAWVLLLLLFAAGFGFAMLMEVAEWVKFRTQVRTQSKRIRRLERELAKYKPADALTAISDSDNGDDDLSADDSGADVSDE